MKALEIGHLWRIAAFDQCFKACLDQLDDTAAEHSLLTEQVGFGFFFERGFNHASACVADGLGVRQGHVFGGACCILMDRDEAGQAEAHFVLRAQCVAGAFWRGQ